MHGHTRLHDNIRNQGDDFRRWTPQYFSRAQSAPLAIHKNWGVKRIANLLVIQGEIAVIDGITIKERILIPALLQDKTINQLYIYKTAIERKRMITHEPIYWMNMDTIVWDAVKSCPTFLDYERNHGNLS